MIRLTLRESILILMEHSTEVAGNKINSMDLALKPGQIRLVIKETMLMEERKGWVNLHGRMAPILKENSLITTFMAKVQSK